MEPIGPIPSGTIIALLWVVAQYFIVLYIKSVKEDSKETKAVMSKLYDKIATIEEKNAVAVAALQDYKLHVAQQHYAPMDFVAELAAKQEREVRSLNNAILNKQNN